MEVFFKQRDDLFFPSWSFVVPTTIMRLPVSFVESLIWTAITYYPVGLAPQASRYAPQASRYTPQASRYAPQASRYAPPR